MKGKEEGGVLLWGWRRGRLEEERDLKEMDEEEDEELKILFFLLLLGFKFKIDWFFCCILRFKLFEIGLKIFNNKKE